MWIQKMDRNDEKYPESHNPLLAIYHLPGCHERAADSKKCLVAHMKVNICRARITDVPEVTRDIFHICATFSNRWLVKPMTARMRGNMTVNAGEFSTFLEELVNTGYIKISTIRTGKRIS